MADCNRILLTYITAWLKWLANFQTNDDDLIVNERGL